MSEITQITNPGPLLPSTGFTVDLKDWASELRAAHQIGTSLAPTTFIPQSLKVGSGNRPLEVEQIAENVAACILAGKSLNIDPMTAVQNIFVVHGKPGMYARTMVALVLRAGHVVYQVEVSEQRVVWEGHRAGESGRKVRSEWTIARARQAGYTSNKKYETNPIEMLTAKCQAELCRLIAPDVLTGIASSAVEEIELEDLGEQDGQQAAPASAPSAARKTSRVQRGRQQAPAPATPTASAPEPAPEEAAEPDANPEGADVVTGEMPEQDQAEPGQHFDEAREAAIAADVEPDQDASAPEPDAAPEKMASRLQRGKLTNALKPSCRDAAEALSRISNWLGRPIASTEEMTETECVEMTAEVEAANAAGADQ